jgi:hypothetical protein
VADSPREAQRYEPVTLTIQVQDAGACTMSVCAPRLEAAVTDCPDAPVSLIAGVPEAAEPAGTANTWNDGPAAGAGAHAKAHPMFQGAAVVVNDVLVQLPFCCGDSKRTRAGPAAADDGVDEAAVVVVTPPAAVVVVAPPAAVVVVVAPAAAVVVVVAPPAAVVVVLPADEPAVPELSAGSLPLPPLDALDAPPPPVSPFTHIPKTAAITATVSSCHVLQDRRSLILRSPGPGRSWEDASAFGLSGGIVTAQVEIPFEPALTTADRADCA